MKIPSFFFHVSNLSNAVLLFWLYSFYVLLSKRMLFAPFIHKFSSFQVTEWPTLGNCCLLGLQYILFVSVSSCPLISIFREWRGGALLLILTFIYIYERLYF